MRYSFCWTGLFAVLATLLTTGKAWVDDENKAKGAQGGERKEAKQAVKRKRVISVEQDGEKKAIEVDITADGQEPRRRGQGAAAEADALRKRIAVLEAELKALRALLQQQRPREEPRIRVAPPAPGQPEGLRSTVTVISRPAVRYYYAYPSCGYYYYPWVWYPTYYYYPSWPCWCGW